MTEHAFTNGIDVEGLKTSMRTVKDQPELGAFRFRARHRWAGSAHNFTTIQDFSAGGHEDKTRPAPFVLEADEPAVLLGQDMGPNATEACLHALASCLSTTLIYHAAARGVEIDALELELDGDLDLRGFLGLNEQVRNGFGAINVTFNVTADASEEQIAELVELAQKRSPVFDIVTHPTPVSCKANKVEPASAERARASI